MKLPRFSLRTMLVAIAIVAAVVGWLRYESQRGWTVEKLEGLIAKEFDANWDYGTFDRWGKEHGFNVSLGYRVRLPGQSVDEFEYPEFWTLLVDHSQGANLGLFAGRGEIEVYFYFDKNKKFYSFSIEKHGADRIRL